MAEHEARRVGLFVTCLVDLIRPTVGFAAVKLLENARCIVDVPLQSCCGQPAFNSGDRATTRDIADAGDRGVRAVRLRGGAVGLLRRHAQGALSRAVSRRSQLAAARRCLRRQDLRAGELPRRRLRGERVSPRGLPATATYHDSCSGLRELGVRAQPRALLRTVDGLKLAEMRDADVCCGFGGTFCVKYPDISNAIVAKKAANIAATGADLLLAGDLGCLMNMAGKLQREGRDIEVRHVAEVLAGMTQEPAIGRPAAAASRRRRGRREAERRSTVPVRLPSQAQEPRPKSGGGRTMTPPSHLATSPRFKENAKAALADPDLQNALRLRRGQFHRAPARGGEPPSRVRGAARLRPRHQEPHARQSRPLPRSLRAAPHRAGRPGALCGDRRGGAAHHPRHLPRASAPRP